MREPGVNVFQIRLEHGVDDRNYALEFRKPTSPATVRTRIHCDLPRTDEFLLTVALLLCNSLQLRCNSELSYGKRFVKVWIDFLRHVVKNRANLHE